MDEQSTDGINAACAERAARGAAAQPPPQAAAPLPPSGFAASGLRSAGHGGSRAGNPPRRPGQHRRCEMEDAELDVFRQGVNCAALLDRMASGWKLDARESTRHALKFRGSGDHHAALKAESRSPDHSPCCALKQGRLCRTQAAPQAQTGLVHPPHPSARGPHP
jgi:hypothetical protein